MSQRSGGKPFTVPGGSWAGKLLPVIAILIVIIGIGAATVRFAQIDEGQRGIVVTQGAVERIQEPGLFVQPFAPFTKVEIVNIKRQTREISQNVASSDKQLYDIKIQVDYSRKSDDESLRAMYGEIGVSDSQLELFLDGFINDALKSASTQFTLDQALSDRGGFANRITQFLTTPPTEGQKAPVNQIYVRLDAVKVLDIQVGEAYAQLLAEKANLEVQIETEEKRRQQIEAQQANNLFQAEQEAKVALTLEKGRTAAALEAAERESKVRETQGRSFRANPELLELRKRELYIQMLDNGNLWFIDPNTDITLLLDQGSGLRPVPTEGTNQTPPAAAPTTPETPAPAGNTP
jgi:regulator of protease activity HflC (stomatin/prohibitin superfamily)